MTYQVLARKWRPQSFAALVGQEPIVTALRNALREGRVAQAYLFSGIRGVGKTTAARVFAKALNCERGPADEPCNECTTCREITAGSDLDVIEIDAATYSKVEQVRELTESLRYGPARDRYKVVVLDEVHRLSRQAFDALLKIVEEPPPHLTFIFATTEIETVPATILSRCQEYHFRRVPAEVLATHLGAIAESENITASDRALRLIARAGEGSVRDSVALLDQLATFSKGEISDDDAVRLLGGLDVALFERLLTAILESRPAEVTAIVREIEDNGWDPRQAFAQFLAYCRDALHLALDGDQAQVDLPPDDIEPLHELAREAGYENVLRLLNQLLSSEPIVRRSEAAALALEVAWLRAAELPKLVRIEELLASAPTAAGADSKGPRSSTPARPAPATRRNPPRTKPTDTAPTDTPPSDTPLSDTASSDTGSSDTGSSDTGPADAATSSVSPDSLAAFLDLVRKERPALRAHLEGAPQLEFDDGALRIAASKDDRLLRDALDRHRALLDRAVSVVWGPRARWRLIDHKEAAAASPAGQQPSPGPPPSESPEVPKQAEKTDPKTARQAAVEKPASSESPPDPPAAVGDDQEERRRAAEHPNVQAVLDVFGGSVDSVEPRDGGRSS